MISTKSGRMRAAPESASTLFQGLTNSLDHSKERLMPKHTKLCAAQECDRTVIEARGLCAKHYQRFMANGSTELQPRPTTSERFWSKVNRHGPIPEFRPDLGRCWIWEAARTDNGQYGRFYDGHRMAYVHRWAWESVQGPIPEGLHIDHLCRVTLCVNPAHLEPVTQAENNRRASRLITHCLQGHPYDEKNTYTRPQGGRRCRECDRLREKRRKARRVRTR